MTEGLTRNENGVLTWPSGAVDVHAHITPDGCWFDSTCDASEETLLRQMDDADVERAVVIALPGIVKNEYVKSVCKRRNSRLSAVAGVNPGQYRSSSEARRDVKKLLEDGCYVGIKLHPRLNQYHPLDERVHAVLETMCEMKSTLAVWIDTMFYCREFMLKSSPVQIVHDLVVQYPMLTFVLAHGCGSDILRLHDAIRQCPNAFMDLSMTMTRYSGSSVDADIRYLMRVFEKRILFGSDFPEVSLSEAKEKILNLALYENDAAIRSVVVGNSSQLVVR